jgi:DNA-binding MarR family transcriptional regulator
MEADGLVERRSDPDDGRATVLVMTRAGRARFAKADAVYTAALRDEFGRHLTAGQAQALEAALRPITRGRAIRALPSRTVRPG